MEVNDQPKRWGCATWSAMIVILVVSYPLSVGPAALVAKATGIEWFFVFYLPLDWAGEKWHVVGSLLEWYIGFFVSP